MLLDLPQLTGSETKEELIESVAKLQKMVQFLMNGKISSNNVREIGGYNVDETELMSADGDVGLSSANDAADPIRIWAGDSVKENAPFRVPKSGKMVATGARLESKAGYPKIVFDPDGNFLKAMQDADRFVLISPFSGGTPALQLFDRVINKSILLYVSDVVGGSVIATIGDMSLSATNGDIDLSGDSVRTDWALFRNGSAAQSLQSALDAKANASAVSKTVYVSTTSGGAATIPMTITNGVVTG